MPSSLPLRGTVRSSEESPATVAVVDDDEAVRHSLGLMLRANGYRTLTYAGGAELLAAPLPGDRDILVIDYVMPSMDGLALVRRLHQLGWNGRVMLITGRYDARLRIRAKAEGVAAMLEKPLEKSLVLQTLARM